MPVLSTLDKAGIMGTDNVHVAQETTKIDRLFHVQIARVLQTIDESKLAKLLGVEEMPADSSKPSKWATAVKEIEALGISSDTWKHINACREEFRADEGV